MSDSPAPGTPSLPARSGAAPLPLPPASARVRRLRWILTGVLALVIALGALGVWAYNTLPRRLDQQQTLVFGQKEFVPGSQGALRVLVRKAADYKPVANADVRLSLMPEKGGPAVPLFRGRTDENGSLGATFQVPETTQVTQTLVIDTRSRLGRDQVKQAVTVQRSYKLLLTTDKPVYQPGQVIHMRALALATLDMKAAVGAQVGFLVEDPKGNKVFRKTVASSGFGVAAADFALANEVINGDYRITVSLGDTSSEKTVNVKPYVLPKFAVRVSTERSFYQPGQHVVGTVQCDYFFGKPVTDGQVEIIGSVFDAQKTQVVQIQGRTDAQGAYRFAFDLPKYFAGRGLEKDQAEFSLQVSVTDQAQHTEQTSKVLPIAQSPIVIEVVAEAGTLKPGVENKLYILTSYPDGMPAPCRLTLDLGGLPLQLSTGDYGLAEHSFVPKSGALRLSVTATDSMGQLAGKVVELKADATADTVLLRPDRATYRLGDTMRLVALTSQDWGSLFLDIVKDGQTLSTRSAPSENGRAEFAVDLSGDLFGALTLHAYKVMADGSLIRDTRVVVVDAPRDLATAIKADREVYRPGETAKVSFRTSTASGAARAALGISIVDESVFAVMEQDPGFAKLYFLLQKELLEPKYQIKGFTLPEVLTSTRDVQLRTTQDRAARAAWAPLPVSGMTVNVNSRPLKIQAAEQSRQNGLSTVSNLALVGLVLVPVGLWVTVILGLHATGILRRALGRFGLMVLVGVFAGPFTCVGLAVALGALYALLAEVASLRVASQVLVVIQSVLLGGWLVAVVGFAVYAWLRRDERARLVWLWLVGWVALGAVLGVALSLGAVPSSWLSILAVLAYLAGLLALLLFGAGLHIEGRRWAAVAALALVLLFIPAAISAAALPQVSRYAGIVNTLGDPLVYSGPLGWLSGCAAPAGSQGSSGGLPLPLPLPRAPLMGAPQPTAAAKTAEEARARPEEAQPPAGAQAPRLRQFFPETLLWLPELQTDGSGLATLDVPLADSITTWRVTALASTQDGQLGFSNAALRVFQDFFVDIDLPVALTQNDEVSIPVAVYNYLGQPQEVRLEVQSQPWFDLLDPPVKSVRIAANDIDVIYFRIKVRQFGEQAFQVTAIGDKMSDAIKRSVAVVPDGRLLHTSESGWLRGSTTINTSLPANAIAGTERIEVKIYPGVVSQVVEGLEKILKLPYGCFEQSTSVTYPNVLVLNYLNTTKAAAPETQIKAESYVATGYQRLLTFEADGGGFSLFGRGKGDIFLSAYGLMQLNDMARVHPVDKAVPERTAKWLLGQQSGDGSWTSRDYRAGKGVLGTTAFVTWALADAGRIQDSSVQRALTYLRQNAPAEKDPYILALVANALVAADPQGEATVQVLDQLANLAVRGDKGASWAGENTMMGGSGRTGSVEATALAAHALIRGGRNAALAQEALTFIVKSKDSWGTWSSTQATIWSLKALVASTSAGDVRDARATVRLSVNGGAAQSFEFTPENADVVRVLTFDGAAVKSGQNSVTLDMTGSGSLMYQVTASYYLPWSAVPPDAEPAGLLSVQVSYDRTTLAVDDIATVNVRAKLTRAGVAKMVLLDLGIPPGFTVQADDLNALVEKGVIARYELTGRQIIVYVENLSSEQTLSFSYGLKARFPIRAKTQPYTGYDYYNPDQRTTIEPVLVTVQEA